MDSQDRLTQTQSVISVANHVVLTTDVGAKTLVELCHFLQEQVESGGMYSEQADLVASLAFSSIVAFLVNLTTFYHSLLEPPPQFAEKRMVTLARKVIDGTVTSIQTIRESSGPVSDRAKVLEVAQDISRSTKSLMCLLQLELSTVKTATSDSPIIWN